MAETIEIPKVPTAEEISEAKILVSEDEVLKNDVYVREILEKGGLLANGNFVEDIGDFLQDRRDAILNQAKTDPSMLEASKASHSGTWINKEQNQ